MADDYFIYLKGLLNLSGWYNLLNSILWNAEAGEGNCEKRSLKTGTRFTPRQVLQGLSWLVIVLGMVVGLLGVLGRQQAEVVVQWDISTDRNRIGFNLYRSDNPTGEYSIINEVVIPSSPSLIAGGSYHYKDRNVIPGRFYYYQLEEIEESGTKNVYGPIEIEAVAGGISEFFIALALLGVGVLGLLATRD